MPRGLYFQASMRWPHMFLSLSPTYLGIAQAAFDFTVRYLRGEIAGQTSGTGGGEKRRQSVPKQLAVAQMFLMLQQMKALWFQAASEARVDPTKEQVLRALAAQYTVMGNANQLAQLALRPIPAEEPAARALLSRQPLRLGHDPLDGRNLSRTHRPRKPLRAGGNGRLRPVQTGSPHLQASPEERTQCASRTVGNRDRARACRRACECV
jgi:alkylation response protein AidB-like acyl-CoA dehydrogenase